MKKALLSIFNFLLYSNIFMALCAVAQGSVSFILLGIKPNEAVLGLLFLATLAVYNFSLLVTKDTEEEKLNNVRLNWFFRHNRLMITITMVASLGLITLFFLLPLKISLLLIIPGIISVFYNIPLPSLKGSKTIGIRHFPLVKQFSIVLVWTVSCVLIPIMLAPYQPKLPFILLLIEQAVFYSIITIPFDIRDLSVDLIKGVKTLPVLFGEKTSYFICKGLIVLNFLLLLMLDSFNFTPSFWALALTLAVTAILILNWKRTKGEYYYFFMLDGVLILQYLLLIVFGKL